MKKILATLLAAVMVLSFTACKKSKNTDNDKTTEGTAQSADVSNSGAANTSSASKGETQTDANGNVITTKSGAGTTSGKNNSGTTSKSGSGDKLDVGEKVAKSVVPEDSYLAKYVQKALAGDKYTVTMSAKTDEGNIKATITKSGDNYAADASVDDITVKIISKDGKDTLCMPADAFTKILSDETAGTDAQTDEITKALFKSITGSKGFYYTIPEEESDGESMISSVTDLFAAFGDDDMEFSGRSTETKDGKTYTVETYKGSDITTKYYFEGTELRFVETTDSSGQSSEVQVSKISTDIDPNAFNIPSGYKDLTATFNALAKTYS